MMTGLRDLSIDGLKIGTWPTPEHPYKGLMIGTWPQPEGPANSVMVGTWPRPEDPADTIKIDTVPLPDQPLPGVMPVAQLLDKELLHKIVYDVPKVKIIEGIDGGIRNPHLHLEDGVVFLDRVKFKEIVGQVAKELADKLAGMK
jgi:hypothetical protein